MELYGNRKRFPRQNKYGTEKAAADDAAAFLVLSRENAFSEIKRAAETSFIHPQKSQKDTNKCLQFFAGYDMLFGQE